MSSNYPQLNLTKEHDFQLYALDNYDCIYMARVDAIKREGILVSDPERTEDKWRTIPGCVIQLANTAVAFPIPLSAKKNWESAIDETCWFARGETNIGTLNSKIWNEWADRDGNCGPIYGEMWRRWPDVKVFHTPEYMRQMPLHSGMMEESEIERIEKEIDRMRKAGYIETPIGNNRILFEGHIDQLLDALNQINCRSRSRRIKVQTFNPGYIGMQALPPCHTNFEFNVLPSTMYEQTAMRFAHGEAFEETLHLEVALRSSDTALGLPFNIIGYTALLHLFAKYCGLNIGSITVNSVNTHVYEHHWAGFEKQQAQFLELVQEVKTTGNPMQYPILRIDPIIHSMEPKELLDNLSFDLFKMEDYNPKPFVSFRVTV